MTTRRRALGSAVIAAGALVLALLLVDGAPPAAGAARPLPRDVAARDAAATGPSALASEPARAARAARADPVAPAPPASAEPQALATPAPPGVQLVVQVVLEHDGVDTPVPGVRVTVDPRAAPSGAPRVSRHALSDAAGRAGFSGMRGDLHVMALREPDHPDGGVWGTASLELWQARGEVPLRVPVRRLGVLHGVVRDPSGRPIEGVEVSNLVTARLDAGPAFTDATGRFVFTHALLGAGTTLSFFHWDYGPEKRLVVVDDDGTWHLRGDGGGARERSRPGPLEVVLTPERVVRGRLVDAAGAGLAGAEVRASGMVPAGLGVSTPDERSARTGADGSFRIDALRRSTRYLIVGDAGERGIVLIVLEPDPDSARVDLGALTVVPRARVTGRVVDARGRPSGGATLEVVYRDAASARGAHGGVPALLGPERYLAEQHAWFDGGFALSLPAGAEQELQVRVDGRVLHRQMLELAEGEHSLGDISLPVDALDVSGTLLDARGEPRGGVPLVVDTGGSAAPSLVTTDDAGRFALHHLAPSADTLRFRAQAPMVGELGSWQRAVDGLPVTLQLGAE